MNRKVVCLFSCGAASAVATRIALYNRDTSDFTIRYMEVVEEHSDNRRFLEDCQRWFDWPISVVRNEKYHGSIYEVFNSVRFIKGFGGAPCSRLLKREIYVEEKYLADEVILGFTAEETERFNNYLDANGDIRAKAPLIENNITKQDCLAILNKAGIEIPAMYKLGYKNNNCRGCVKGGKGYWNKIRVDFPEFFERMATMQDKLGPGSYFWQDGKGGRLSLRMLDPNTGNYSAEPNLSCGAICEMAAEELCDV